MTGLIREKINEIREEISTIETLGEFLCAILIFILYLAITGFLSFFVAMAMHVILFGPHSFPVGAVSYWLVYDITMSGPFVIFVAVMFWVEIGNVLGSLMNVRLVPKEPREARKQIEDDIELTENKIVYLLDELKELKARERLIKSRLKD